MIKLITATGKRIGMPKPYINVTNTTFKIVLYL